MPARNRGRSRRRSLAFVAVFLLIVGLAVPVKAADDDPATAPPPEPPANKLTVAYYDFSSGTTGADVNLRHTFKSTTGWIAFYRQSDGFEQARVGFEYDYHGRWLTLVPSGQAASHGFLGATVYGEIGRRLFAIAGAGRTNLQPYWNLGFDPNDYIQVGAGYRNQAGDTVSVYAIHDDRLDTGQTNTHMTVREYLGRDWRLTVDVVNEHGRGDDDLVVNAWAVSIDTDWRRWFVRVAEDPHVNYTPDRQIRIAGGVRF